MSQLLSRHGEPDTHWRFGAVLSQLNADDGVIESLYVCDHFLVCLGRLENRQLLWRHNTFWNDTSDYHLIITKFSSIMIKSCMSIINPTSQKASYVDSRYSTFYNVGRDVIFVSSDSHSGVLTSMPVAKVAHFAWCYSQGPMTIKMQEEIQTTPFTVMLDFTLF